MGLVPVLFLAIAEWHVVPNSATGLQCWVLRLAYYSGAGAPVHAWQVGALMLRAWCVTVATVDTSGFVDCKQLGGGQSGGHKMTERRGKVAEAMRPWARLLCFLVLFGANSSSIPRAAGQPADGRGNKWPCMPVHVEGSPRWHACKGSEATGEIVGIMPLYC